MKTITKAEIIKLETQIGRLSQSLKKVKDKVISNSDNLSIKVDNLICDLETVISGLSHEYDYQVGSLRDYARLL